MLELEDLLGVAVKIQLVVSVIVHRVVLNKRGVLVFEIEKDLLELLVVRIMFKSVIENLHHKILHFKGAFLLVA